MSSYASTKPNRGSAVSSKTTSSSNQRRQTSPIQTGSSSRMNESNVPQRKSKTFSSYDQTNVHADKSFIERIWSTRDQGPKCNDRSKSFAWEQLRETDELAADLESIIESMKKKK